MTLSLIYCSSGDNKINIEWDNSLILPPNKGMSENIGLAGRFSGFIGNELIIGGGANFPAGLPWESGKKVCWPTLYAFNTQNGEWTVYEDFFDQGIGYGVSIQLPNGVLCIGGCDASQCFSDVILIKKSGSVLVKKKYPPLPVPLANASGVVLNNKIYIAGGQEAMVREESTKYFFVLDLNMQNPEWDELPSWPGPSRGYAVCVAQDNKVMLFSGRSYCPGEETMMHTDGYYFDPDTVEWTKIEGSFPVMAGTAIPYQEDKIIFIGGVEEILPTTPDHPGFSHTVRIFDTKTQQVDSLAKCPYDISVTTNVVQNGDTFYIASGEIRPGIRTPHLLKGYILGKK